MFRINPTDWNNVPKIVYECLTTIITRVDIHVGSTGKFKKDMMKS